jgi:predicted lipoprotein with Yx(FWY)xxD motif
MKTRILLLGPAILLLGALVGCSSDRNADNYSTQSGGADYMENESYMSDSSIGSVMTTPQGMTVYSYDKDQPGASNCYGECASHWPPVTASSNAVPYGNMTIINRSDGRRQWAYNGMPLYTYVDDTSTGDVTGDKEGGVWHVVK